MLDRLRLLLIEARDRLSGIRYLHKDGALPANTVAFSFDPEFTAEGWVARVNVYSPDNIVPIRPVALYFAVEEYLKTHELHAHYKRLGKKIVVYGGEMHTTEII